MTIIVKYQSFTLSRQTIRINDFKINVKISQYLSEYKLCAYKVIHTEEISILQNQLLAIVNMYEHIFF